MIALKQVLYYHLDQPRENNMHTMKSFGWVILASILAALPGSFTLHEHTVAPAWYILAVTLVSAVGIGLVAMVLGGGVLVAARRRENQRKLAIGVAFGVGLLCSILIMASMPSATP